ncbi:MAG: ABC transporter ATP-binding protein [Bryobacterales bacterium]|nr:ABC transporter ATP-binding protein [Bryobacterales bacterium]
MTVIEFKNVSKGFHRAVGQRLLRHYLEDLLGKSDPDSFHALRNVNFAINDGESVAIIGANGAGKSTLLSLVTRLAPPSSGEVIINGRVAALLELGAGFHPDLTGRENIRLNASLLGFSRKQAGDLYESIVDFSELHDFIDEPLRTYSNGMMLRLAFAVAVNLDPQILIIDEVLAVGDQQFQAKCMDKIYEIRNQGRTILCVSHALGILQTLCTRALWLDHGQLIMDGPVAEVLHAYEGRALHAPSE